MRTDSARLIKTTLLLIRSGNRILLAKKKRGFGAGKYNGIGGKIEVGETSEQAMLRECQEEIAVVPTKYKMMGTNEFLEFYKGVQERVTFDIYVATEWTGGPKETEEMQPEWFEIDNIPYDTMFPDDRYWLPLVLNGKYIQGYFEFDADWKMLAHEVRVDEVKSE